MGPSFFAQSLNFLWLFLTHNNQVTGDPNCNWLFCVHRQMRAAGSGNTTIQMDSLQSHGSPQVESLHLSIFFLTLLSSILPRNYPKAFLISPQVSLLNHKSYNQPSTLKRTTVLDIYVHVPLTDNLLYYNHYTCKIKFIKKKDFRKILL